MISLLALIKRAPPGPRRLRDQAARLPDRPLMYGGQRQANAHRHGDHFHAARITRSGSFRANRNPFGQFRACGRRDGGWHHEAPRRPPGRIPRSPRGKESFWVGPTVPRLRDGPELARTDGLDGLPLRGQEWPGRTRMRLPVTPCRTRMILPVPPRRTRVLRPVTCTLLETATRWSSPRSRIRWTNCGKDSRTSTTSKRRFRMELSKRIRLGARAVGWLSQLAVGHRRNPAVGPSAEIMRVPAR